jgi:hypothetical protein
MIQPACSWPQNDKNASLGLPLPAIADSRSQTSFSGRTPSREIERARPARMSGASLLNTKVPANARDQHDCVVTTHPRRVWP